jgi:hypothetical protein
MLKCSDLQKNRPVVFNLFDEIYGEKRPMDGSVIYVLPEKRTVCVSYLDGYKSLTEDVPYEDMLAAYDKDGEMMKFDNIKGPSVLLVAE